jgi:hypothetical protein
MLKLLFPGAIAGILKYGLPPRREMAYEKFQNQTEASREAGLRGLIRRMEDAVRGRSPFFRRRVRARKDAPAQTAASFTMACLPR